MCVPRIFIKSSLLVLLNPPLSKPTTHARYTLVFKRTALSLSFHLFDNSTCIARTSSIVNEMLHNKSHLQSFAIVLEKSLHLKNYPTHGIQEVASCLASKFAYRIVKVRTLTFVKVCRMHMLITMNIP